MKPYDCDVFVGSLLLLLFLFCFLFTFVLFFVHLFVCSVVRCCLLLFVVVFCGFSVFVF